jgi:DNA-binding HxlR family transcriptional regulator
MRRPYDRRPRYEYVLTEKGAELVDLLMVMVGWGDKWHAGDVDLLPGPGAAM